MGPKKKAPKKTKEELEEERRLQEEAEARARAEEEKRLEEERRKRELEAARRREEAARQRAAELERLAHEADTAQPDLDGKASRLADILRARKEANEWERYVACEPRPNAEVEGDLNSFVNAWLLDAASAIDEPQPLAAVVSAAASVASVLNDLSFAAAGARAANDSRLVDQCTRFVSQLRSLVIEQVELATARVLQFADEYADAGSSGTSGSLSGSNAANRGEVRLSSAQDGVALGLWVNLLAKSGRGKKVDFGAAVGVAVDLPKAVMLQSLALRALHWPFDHLSATALGGGRDVVALGGVFAVELLAIPAPPKRARGWVMRELPESAAAGEPQQHTKRLSYPLEGMVASAALPIKVSLALPPQISLAVAALASAAELRVGWWDASSASWQEDGISDPTFVPETNSVTFSTLRLAPLAVLQRRDLHFHKRSWHLTMDTASSGDGDGSSIDHDIPSSGGSRALLTMSTETLKDIQFLVTDAGCALLSPSVPHLVPPTDSNSSDSASPLLLEPGELLMRLAACGIDLCPPVSIASDPIADTSSAVVDGGKLKALEDRVTDEIVRIVAAYEVRVADLSLLAPPPESTATRSDDADAEEYGPDYSSMTRWRAAVDDPKKIAFSVREVLWPYIDTCDDDDLIAAGDVEETRASPITVLAEVDTEAAGGGVAFRLDRSCRADPYDSNVHLAAALDGFSSPDARDRMAASNVLFEFTLKKLLHLLRLFSSSTPAIASSSAQAALAAAALALADEAATVELDGVHSGRNEAVSSNNEPAGATEDVKAEGEGAGKEPAPENPTGGGDIGGDSAIEATSAAEPVA